MITHQNESMRRDADAIMKAAIQAALPDTAVQKALQELPVYEGKLILIAVGKAAWQMAAAAYDRLGDRVDTGMVITKHGYAQGPIGPLVIREAGHPVPDADSYDATRDAVALVQDLSEKDLVLFLLSGGGSALFEQPLLEPEEMESVTRQLLACGADIVEINTLRKRFSGVKGGKFARLCQPAKVYSVVLSDILGDPLDMIASGPAYPDSSTGEQAAAIAEKYGLTLSDKAKELLRQETPKELTNVQTVITGSVKQLCRAAEECSRELGYQPVVLTADLSCEAKEAGRFLGAIARTHRADGTPYAFIAGGETVVHVTGTGKGGRNQEIALSAAAVIDGLKDTLIFSLGSDGTDGPTDAAGGIVDGDTAARLREKGISPEKVLQNNDAYPVLKAVDGLIITGPTGTNVNDVSVLLMR